ncbi:hypothetical protein H5410_034738 [Solanum commersonii]|uniref:Uncharacterized protein n=1 Tax=Solanum commersonii TaxID=4109 RepID=A0A9J5YUC5_SOLCO|nr:hypothetical protein H5410_034738 [Solanum commersonii]
MVNHIGNTGCNCIRTTPDSTLTKSNCPITNPYQEMKLILSSWGKYRNKNIKVTRLTKNIKHRQTDGQRISSKLRNCKQNSTSFMPCKTEPAIVV